MDEIVPVPQDQVTLPEVQIVRPFINAVQAKKAWLEYQELKKSFLDPNLDYQSIPMFQKGKGMVKKSFIKKSGWRKLATAFNLSIEIVKEERKEHLAMEYKHKDKITSIETIEIKPGFVVEVTAKVIAMNGRYMYGLGSCASNERDFSKLEHDIRATAETRAKNRAISDLIGGGEVSAEEIEEQTKAKQNLCSVDHANLPDRIVASESKNKGRHYVKCDKCSYYSWIDAPKAEETEDSEKVVN